MSNFVDEEPQTFRERFDAIETVLAIQRKRLEDIEGHLVVLKKAALAQLMTLAMVTGGRLALPDDLAAELGLQTSSILQPSSIIKPS